MSARTSHTTTGVATQGRTGGRTRPEYLGSPGRCQRRGPLGRHIQCVGRRPWVGFHVPTFGSRTPSERGRQPVGHPPKFARHATLLAAPIRSRHCPLWGGVSGSACIASQATRCPTPTLSRPGHRVPASPAPLVSSWMKSGGFGRGAQGYIILGSYSGWSPSDDRESISELEIYFPTDFLPHSSAYHVLHFSSYLNFLLFGVIVDTSSKKIRNQLTNDIFSITVPQIQLNYHIEKNDFVDAMWHLSVVFI